MRVCERERERERERVCVLANSLCDGKYGDWQVQNLQGGLTGDLGNS